MQSVHGTGAIQDAWIHQGVSVFKPGEIVARNGGVFAGRGGKITGQS